MPKVEAFKAHQRTGVRGWSVVTQARESYFTRSLESSARRKMGPVSRRDKASATDLSKSQPVLLKPSRLGELFHELALDWKADTQYASSLTEMALHPSYQRIIGLGYAAVPFILNELRSSPDHWFWALQSITGENPAPPALNGRMNEMTQLWIEWGKRKGYLV